METTKLQIKPELEKYLPSFIDDTTEALNALETGLLDLERTDLHNVSENETLHEVFRRIHQIKGNSGTMSFSALSHLAHEMETVLSRVRSKQFDLSKDMISLLLRCTDRIKECVAQIQSGQSADLAIQDLINHLQTPEVSAQPKAAPPSPGLSLSLDERAVVNDFLAQGLLLYRCQMAVSPQAILPDARALVVLSRVNEACVWMKSSPSIAQLESAQTDCSGGIECLCVVDFSKEEFVRLFEIDQISVTHVAQVLSDEFEGERQALPAEAVGDAAGDAALVIESLGGSEKSPERGDIAAPSSKNHHTIRIDVERLDTLINMSGELVISKARFLRFGQEFKDCMRAKDLFMRMQSIRNSVASTRNMVGDKNSAEHVKSQLGDIVAECDHLAQSIKHLESVRHAYHHYEEAYHQLDLISNDIQKAVMNIRMVPVGLLFERFHRVVRDVCKETGKEVRLLLQGSDTEADKRMIDELGDPLIQLVRNAIDHGVESPGDRIQSGKEAVGTVILNAYQTANRICITIQDDGRGIDTGKIKKMAVAKGIYTQEAADQLSEIELINVIFSPGFTTAAKVSSISGRGVGLDIVKKKIEDLNGVIEIRTEPGKGSAFVISLPLTLAVQKSLICEIGKTTYALPIEYVQEIVEIKDKKIHQLNDRFLVRIREKVFPVFHLNQFFKSTHHEAHSFQHPMTVVILSSFGHTVALMVDRLLGEQDIIIKALENLHTVFGISGASIMGDGRVALILDVSALIGSLTQSGVWN